MIDDDSTQSWLIWACVAFIKCFLCQGFYFQNSLEMKPQECFINTLKNVIVSKGNLKKNIPQFPKNNKQQLQEEITIGTERFVYMCVVGQYNAYSIGQGRGHWWVWFGGGILIRRIFIKCTCEMAWLWSKEQMREQTIHKEIDCSDGIIQRLVDRTKRNDELLHSIKTARITSLLVDSLPIRLVLACLGVTTAQTLTIFGLVPLKSKLKIFLRDL